MTRSEDRSAVWIDFANSPHVVFFRPVVAELQARGVPVLYSARPFNQTVPLAQKYFDDVAVVGAWGRSLLAKGSAVATRALALRRFAGERPIGLAVSHNSYAQLLAARSLRIPAVTAMDYEHQPANHLAFRLADVVLVPEVFPDEALRRFGARDVRRYPGLKEEVYLDHEASPDVVRSLLGVGERPLVVLRPPPDSAAYHRFENPLFAAAVDHLTGDADAFLLLIPRSERQAAAARDRWGTRVTIPETVFDGQDLLRSADLVISGGGTMNREAALLGTPTVSVFAGQPSAVDQELVDRGLLTVVRSEEDLSGIGVRRKPAPRVAPTATNNAVLETVVATILERLDAAS